MAKTLWKNTSPPKRKVKPVRIKFQYPSGGTGQALFVWSDMEKTWVQVNDGPDGIALYESDGWKILGWR